MKKARGRVADMVADPDPVYKEPRIWSPRRVGFGSRSKIEIYKNDLFSIYESYIKARSSISFPEI